MFTGILVIVVIQNNLEPFFDFLTGTDIEFDFPKWIRRLRKERYSTSVRPSPPKNLIYGTLKIFSCNESISKYIKFQPLFEI
jgi:hypothetical protein